jgi:hypothetical protein
MRLLLSSSSSSSSSSSPAIHFASGLFLLCVFCITVVHYMRSDAHDAFRFGGGDVLREGAVGGGCEPKDIISLGDDLSSDPLISSMQTHKDMIALDKDPKFKDSFETFFMNALIIKYAATMRSKPDEQNLRKIMSEGAAEKKTDCTMKNLIGKIEATSVSADTKNTIKKFATRMTNMGQCLGWCK